MARDTSKDHKNTLLQIVFPPTIARDLKGMAYKQGTTVSELVRRAVMEHYKLVVK